MSRNMRLSSMAYLVGIVVIAAYWGAYYWEQATRRELVLLTERGANPPFLLNGLRIDAVQLAADPVAVGDRSTLLLISADSCPYCAEEKERWMKLAKSLPFRVGDTVVLLSIDAGLTFDPVERELRARDVRVTRLRNMDRDVVKRVLAVTATPQTLLLDASSRVRFIATRITDTGERILRESYVEQVAARSFVR